MNHREESLSAIPPPIFLPTRNGKIKQALHSLKLTKRSANLKGVWQWYRLLKTGMMPRQLGWLKLIVPLN